MNLKLDDIVDTLKDIQKPCSETDDGGVDNRFSWLEETIKAMANDISEIKSMQTEMKEEIKENRQHATSKYTMLEEEFGKMKSDISEIKTKQTDIKAEINENRQYALSKYRELNADTKERFKEITVRLNENREYSTAKYHEIRVETNDHIMAANTKHRELKQSYDELNQHVDRKVKTSGTTYVRWGRTTCPGNGSEVIYSGYAGGSHKNHTGAAVSMLCLPTDPDWELYKDTEEDWGGLVFGTEYEFAMGRTNQFFGTGHVNQDVPCAVCNVRRRSLTITVPGKRKCYPGWTLEYSGYLMSGDHTTNSATDYYCIDNDPENVTGGGEGRNDDGKLLYFVEARCGSLKCPPYVNGRELTCVICSR